MSQHDSQDKIRDQLFAEVWHACRVSLLLLRAPIDCYQHKGRRQQNAADLAPEPQLLPKRRRGRTVSATHLDLRKRHADARELNADVVCPPVLHQQYLIAPRLGQPPQCCVLQNLQVSTEQKQSTQMEDSCQPP